MLSEITVNIFRKLSVQSLEDIQEGIKSAKQLPQNIEEKDNTVTLLNLERLTSVLLEKKNSQPN